MANCVDPDQTAPIGAVCSRSTLFASMLNSSVICSRRLQQTTFSDALFLLGVLRVYNFSAQFIKIISHYKNIGYNINVLQQTACLVVNPITVGNLAFLFNCSPVAVTYIRVTGHFIFQPCRYVVACVT